MISSSRTPPPDLPADSGISYDPSRSERIAAVFPPPPASPKNQTRWVVSQIAQTSETAEAATSESSQPPNQFVLRHIIGRGGFGEVWEAVQSSLGRVVAIKRLRPDLAETTQDSSISARRLELSFRQEALTAGNLDHPNIVPIHDLGLDEEGNPLLAMKLVRGIPWEHQIRDDYVKTPELDFLSRHLPVLVDVAQAVAFAHSRGIVHRDLKPSQVMVGEFGETMLMDWGLAVAFDPKLAFTATGGAESVLQLPTTENATNPAGTPAYMAPEQTESDARNIGPWTDVYLLGGMLYYLLTGTHPHFSANSTEAFARAALGEFMPPSTRSPRRRIPPELEGLCAEAMTAERQARLGSAAQFVQRLQDYLSGASRRREAENFARQAMECLQAPAAGYRELTECVSLLTKALANWPDHPEWPGMIATAIERHIRLAIDCGDLVLGRLLAERLADPDRRGKLVQEIVEGQRQAKRLVYQRRAYLGAAVALVFVVLWVGYSLRLANANTRLAIQQKESEEARAKLLADINNLTEAESELALKLGAVLPVPPAVQLQEDEGLTEEEKTQAEALLKDRDALREKRQALYQLVPDGRMPAEPYELLLANANALILGTEERDACLRAHQEYERAVAVAPKMPEPLVGMGIAAARAGYPTSATVLLEDAARVALARYGAQHRSYAHVLELQGQAARKIDDDSTDYVKYYRASAAILFDDWSNLSFSLGEQLEALGSYDEAVLITSETLEMHRRMGTDGWHARRAEGERILGETLLLKAEPQEALKTFREGLAILAGKEDHESSRVAIDLWSGVARSLDDLSEFKEAEEAHRKAYESSVSVYGAESSNAATLLSNMGLNAMAQGDLVNAEQRLLESIRISVKTLGTQHPEVLRIKGALASVYFRQSRADEALKLMEEVVDGQREAFGAEHPEVARSLHNLGEILIDNVRWKDAEVALRQCLDMRLRLLGPEHPDVAGTHTSLARALSRMDRFQESELEYREALRIMRVAPGTEKTQLAALLNNLALNLERQNRHDEATPFLQEALAICQETLGEGHQFTATAYDNIARNMSEQGDAAGALPISEKALQIRRKVAGPDHADTMTSLMNTGALYLELGDVEKAETLCRESFESAIRVFGPNHYRTAFAATNLARVMLKIGNEEEATRLLALAARIRVHQLGTESFSTMMTVRQVADQLRKNGRRGDGNELLGWIMSNFLPGEEPLTLQQAQVIWWLLDAKEEDTRDEDSDGLLQIVHWYFVNAFPDSRTMDRQTTMEHYLAVQLWLARGCFAMEPLREEEGKALIRRARKLALEGRLEVDHPFREKLLDPLSDRAGLPKPHTAEGKSPLQWPMKAAALEQLLVEADRMPDFSFVEHPKDIDAALKQLFPQASIERVKEILESVEMPAGVTSGQN